MVAMLRTHRVGLRKSLGGGTLYGLFCVRPAATNARLDTALPRLCPAIPHLNRQRVLHWMLAKRVSFALHNLAATGNGDWDLAFARLLLNLEKPPPYYER